MKKPEDEGKIYYEILAAPPGTLLGKIQLMLAGGKSVEWILTKMQEQNPNMPVEALNRFELAVIEAARRTMNGARRSKN